MKQTILINFWKEFRQHVKKVRCPLEFKYDNEKERWTKLRLEKPDPILLLEPVRTKQIILAQIRFLKPETTKIYERFYKNDKADIESKIGSRLIWRNEPGKVVCTINLEEKFDLGDEKKWEWAFNWIIEKANLFMAEFNPRLGGSSNITKSWSDTEKAKLNEPISLESEVKRPVQKVRASSPAQKTEDHKTIGANATKAVGLGVQAQSRLRPPGASRARNITLIHSSEDYEWAKKAAVNEWNGGEGEMHEGLLRTQYNYNGEKLFGNFLSKFGIARCITKVGKPLLLQEFISNWRSVWENANPGDNTAYESVDRFAHLISEKGWASKEGATMTSLASKMAFMSNPAVFIPYDKYNFKGLSRCGMWPPVHDYPAYMSALIEISNHLSANLEIDLPLLMPKMKRPIIQRTLRMRVIDKLMMKVGGFQSKE